jgi:hypothetical protein
VKLRGSLIRSALVAGIVFIAAASSVSAAGDAKVRVLHGSPDAPNVDVVVDGSKVLTNVPFGAISDYLTVPAGKHQVQVFATGTTTGAVIDANLTLDAGTSYTVAATNSVAKIEAQVIVDDPSASCDTAQVRAVHLSADAPAVDVAPHGSDASGAVVKSLTYPNNSGYLALPGGSYNLDVRLAGTTTVALALGDVAVKDCNSYSVFVIGSAASPAVGKGLTAVVAVDETTTAAVGTPAPDQTLPPTDTEPVTGGSGTPTLPIVLIGAGLATIALALVIGFARMRSASRD